VNVPANPFDGGFPFQDLSDIFGDLFGISGDLFGAGGNSRRGRVRQGADVGVELALEFEEAIFGKTTEVRVRALSECEKCNGTGGEGGAQPVPCSSCGGRGQVRFQQGFFSITRPCSKCSGTGSVVAHPCSGCRGERRVPLEKTVSVKVPAGVEDGTRILFSGQGHAGVQGGSAGDLYVTLKVREHAFFEREGRDLYCAIPVSLAQAALGAEIMLPTLDGELKLSVPAGTQSGTALRLKGKGVPVLRGHGRGDLFVEVRVQIPGKLTKRQRELLQELGETLTIENRPQPKTLLRKVKDMFS